MSETDFELRATFQRIEAALDRSLSVPMTIQIRGALEYGIATGEIPAGAQLPSVRAFATRLKVSPVTVSNAYSALRVAGLVEGRVGSGSYVVPGAVGADEVSEAHRLLQARIDDLVEMAAALGLDRRELAFRVASATARRRALRILMLGIFPEATDYYASVLRAHVPQRDEVLPTTFEAERAEPSGGIDLIVTPRNVRAEAERLHPGIPVVGMTFIPTETTRIELARIAPEARVAIVSYFPDFLTLMKAGIMRFAPHVTSPESTLWDAPDIAAILGRCDVLIHATGADALRQRLHPGQTAIEYRHTPDPHAIRTDLLPAIEARRNIANDKDGIVEDRRQQLVRG